LKNINWIGVVDTIEKPIREFEKPEHSWAVEITDGKITVEDGETILAADPGETIFGKDRLTC
jgi:hypothetical protein